MAYRFPLDIKAETLVNHLHDPIMKIELRGTHKRNAYEDILAMTEDECGDGPVVALSRNGIYDILPEALFHPVDRFENIPANEYKERFAEECEAQQAEESDAREFFEPFDRFIFDLGCEYEHIKDVRYNDNSLLADIIGDNMPERYRSNRFVKRMTAYLPLCSRLRGNMDLINILIRKIMRDEGLLISAVPMNNLYRDPQPLYNSEVGILRCESSEEYYLGNEFFEQVTEYVVSYWDDNECNDSFLSFVEDVKVFENFINDYFMGIETSVRFRIGTDAPPVRLSDSLSYNFLDYNTNL